MRPATGPLRFPARHPIFLRELACHDAANREITAIAIADACEAPKRAQPGGGTSHRVLLRLDVEEHRLSGPGGVSRSLRAGRLLSAETIAFREPGLFQCHRPARAQVVRKAFQPRQRSFEAVEQPRRPLSFAAGGGSAAVSTVPMRSDGIHCYAFTVSRSKLRTYVIIAPGVCLALNPFARGIRVSLANGAVDEDAFEVGLHSTHEKGAPRPPPSSICGTAPARQPRHCAHR